MKLIVGLGNPGRRYEATRHNVGFMVVQAFASEFDISFGSQEKIYTLGSGKITDHPVWVALPGTFMNQSGFAVKRLLERTGSEPSHLVVVHDDMDLSLGRIQIKTKGGHGGHKGIISILTALQTDRFNRLRVGIGRPFRDLDPSDHVLDSFSRAEQSLLDAVLRRSVQALHCMIVDGVQKAMDRFNRKLIQNAP